MSYNTRITDPLTGPSNIQPGESDSDYAYRHSYRYAYGVPGAPAIKRHSTARAYADYVKARFLGDPSLMGTWDHANEYPIWKAAS